MKKSIVMIMVFVMLLCSCALADDLIKQYLVNRNGGAVSDFLYPAVYNGSAFPMPTEEISLDGNSVFLWDDDVLRYAQDKIVYVKNVSDETVFFRTVVAIPAPNDSVESKIRVNYSTTDYDLSTVYATINDKRHKLLIFSHQTALAAGTASAPSLLQIALDKTVTNQDVTALGGRLDLLVKSEAFSLSDDLSSTVYQITEDKHPWSSYN